MDKPDPDSLMQPMRSDKVPAKYATLKQVEAAGLCVPKSLLIDTDVMSSSNGKVLECADVYKATADIEDFFDNLNCLRFIVRSANLAEDGSEYSLAGHFWSSEAVSKSAVVETIEQAKLENCKVLESLGLSAAPYLILQEYIEHGVGGVLFSPWSFFTDYAFVEYSEQGVKSVVEGADSHCAVICLGEHDDPLPLLESQHFLKPLLVDLCSQLKRVFDFPVDCEWAYDSHQQRIVVLQVRPQTHLIGPVLPLPPSRNGVHGLARASGVGEQLGDSSLLSHSYNDSQWQFTALSESLGRISPLSFSLLKQLYSDARGILQQLGCKAEAVNFMHHAPDGTVLVDPELETNFYKMTLFGGFKRGLKQTELQNTALQIMREYDAPAAFSYDSLSKLFQYWLVSNVLSDGAGRNNVSENSGAVHAYELMWPAILEVPLPPENKQWEALNRSGRALFLYELNKLKHKLAQGDDVAFFQEITGNVPSKISENSFSLSENLGLQDDSYADVAFYTWDEYSSHDYSKAKERQHAQAHQALYDHALISGGSLSEVQSLSTTTVVSGELFVIANPAHFSGQIPDDCILAASYFDNRWVGRIGEIKGIIVNRGSRLSHSAIVAREHSVPYYVVSELELSGLSSGSLVTLDAGKIGSLRHRP